MAERRPDANGEEDGGREGGLLQRSSRLYAVNQRLFGGGSGFVALPHDGRLESILSEAFACMEHQFATMDKDGAGIIMFSMLETQLALHGFYDLEALQSIWKRIDVNGKGYLDFAEFLCLLFLWSGVGDYTNFFDRPENSKCVQDAFKALEYYWQLYDVDNSRRFSHDELTRFLIEQLPSLAPTSLETVDRLYPMKQREAGVELSFPRFMHMMYMVLCECMSSSRIPGRYSKLGLAKQERAVVDQEMAEGVKSSTWIFLLRALEVLEQDFARFDKSGDGYIDYVELTMGLPMCDANQKLSIMTRLEYKFKQVDLDHTNTVDFYEFIYLGFLMTQDGSYHDLVEESEGHDVVKKAFIELLSWYSQSDSSRRQRLNIVDVQQFCLLHFRFLPDNLEDTFEEFSYESSSLRGQKVVDFVRFLKLLAMLIVPDSKFHPNRYRPVKKAADDSKRLVKAHGGRDQKRPARIDPVVTSKFVRQKKVGTGGQGAVYSGYYDGILCAGKFMVGEMNDNRIKAVEREAQILLKLDHPHCHFFVGAKTTLDKGGPLVLTELCDEGSLFDVYARKQRKLDAHTSWRLACECAQGCGYIHEVGYIHRDIKSLNILLTANFVARVADFGMATDKQNPTDAAGTVQWMAPEVLDNFKDSRSKVPYDNRCDIYSFGVLLWEIYHCRCPYADLGLDQMQIAYQVVTNGIRPKIDPFVNQAACAIIEKCWAKDPGDRPSFPEIQQLLESDLRP